MAMTAESLRGPLHFAIDLKNGLIQQPIRSQLMKGDKSANTVVVALTDGDKAVDLTGVTVTGSFISPLDGAEIPMTGSVDGNKAIVTLIDECYAEDGYFECHIKLTAGNTSRTILSFTGNVLSKGSGAVIDIGNVIPSIDDIIAQYKTMQEVTESTNAAKEAANTAAKYASDEAKKIDGLTVDAKSTDMPSAEVSMKNGVRHISFGLVTPRITFEVETGAAGTDVKIEQSGTPENPVVKLTIPRGDTGNVNGLDYYEGDPAALGEASPGTANGVARGNHVHPMPSAKDVGALPIGGTAEDAGKLGGKEPKYYIQPRNILDNSYFGDSGQIINQRDSASYSGTDGYSIDRWRRTNGLTVTVSSKALALENVKTDDLHSLYQLIEDGKIVEGKRYSFAVATSDGNVYVGSADAPSPGIETVYTEQISIEDRAHMCLGVSTDGMYQFRIRVGIGKTLELAWAAVYEGDYTIDNLPPYMPKGYVAELAECQRYYFVTKQYTQAFGYSSTEDNVCYCTLPLPQVMRINNPTLTKSDTMSIYIDGGSHIGFTLGQSSAIKGSALRFSLLRESDNIIPKRQTVLAVVSGGLEVSADL